MPIYSNSASSVQTTETLQKTTPGHNSWQGVACPPITHNAPQIDETTYRNIRIIGADFIARTPIYRANRALHISPSKKAIIHLSDPLASFRLLDIQTCSRPVDQITIGADSSCARRFIVQIVPMPTIVPRTWSFHDQVSHIFSNWICIVAFCTINRRAHDESAPMRLISHLALGQEKEGKQQKPGKQKEREGDKGSQRIKKQKGK